MSFGTKMHGENVVCLNCNVVVGKNQTKFSFCPRCGAPLTMEAGELEEKKFTQEKLKLLYAILDENETLKPALEKYIKELEE